MVTISNCKAVLKPLLAGDVHVQQPVRRLDHNPARPKMHADHDCVGHGNQNLVRAPALHDQPASLASAFYPGHDANRHAFGGFDGAANEVVLIREAIPNLKTRSSLSVIAAALRGPRESLPCSSLPAPLTPPRVVSLLA